VGHHRGEANGGGRSYDPGEQGNERHGANGEVALPDVAQQMLVVRAVGTDPVVPKIGDVGVEGRREEPCQNPGTRPRKAKKASSSLATIRMTEPCR
jgi:hypothetical protein